MNNNEHLSLRQCKGCERWFKNEEPACDNCKPVVTKDECYSSQGNLTDVYLAREMPKHEPTKKEK